MVDIRQFTAVFLKSQSQIVSRRCTSLNDTFQFGIFLFKKMTENKIILAKGASNNFKDLLIVDSFKFRKVYESISGNVTWRCTMKSCFN